jgi:hypothetical protein
MRAALRKIAPKIWRAQKVLVLPPSRDQTYLGYKGVHMKKIILIAVLCISTAAFAADRKVADFGGATPPAILANCHTAITSMGDKGITLIIGRNAQDAMWATITNNNRNGKTATANFSPITQNAKSGAVVRGGPVERASFTDADNSFSMEELGESQGGTHVILNAAGGKAGIRVPQELICPSFNVN